MRFLEVIWCSPAPGMPSAPSPGPSQRPALSQRGPHQPRNFNFPQRSFGITNPSTRSFSSKWFDRWSWLHYSEEDDKAFCWVCMKARRDNLLTNPKADLAFTQTGYKNWKNATTKEGFPAHEASHSHQEAVERVVTIKTKTRDVGETLSAGHKEEKKINRRIFLKILENIRFLARQGLALRGRDDDHNSNFMQLYHLRAIDNPELETWLKKKVSYTGAKVQNEILQTMALQVLQEVASSVQNSDFFLFWLMKPQTLQTRNNLLFASGGLMTSLRPMKNF